MDNKKGWIRIFEASIAILLVSSVLIVVYSRQPDRNLGTGEYIYNVQRGILNDITTNKTLRDEVLSVNDSNATNNIISYIDKRVPTALNSRILICDLRSPCKLNSTDFLQTRNYDLFSIETVISANLSDYSPKKIKLLMWERI